MTQSSSRDVVYKCDLSESIELLIHVYSYDGAPFKFALCTLNDKETKSSIALDSRAVNMINDISFLWLHSTVEQTVDLDFSPSSVYLRDDSNQCLLLAEGRFSLSYDAYNCLQELTPGIQLILKTYNNDQLVSHFLRTCLNTLIHLEIEALPDSEVKSSTEKCYEYVKPKVETKFRNLLRTFLFDKETLDCVFLDPYYIYAKMQPLNHKTRQVVYFLKQNQLL